MKYFVHYFDSAVKTFSDSVHSDFARCKHCCHFCCIRHKFGNFAPHFSIISVSLSISIASGVLMLWNICLGHLSVGLSVCLSAKCIVA